MKVSLFHKFLFLPDFMNTRIRDTDIRRSVLQPCLSITRLSLCLAMYSCTALFP